MCIPSIRHPTSWYPPVTASLDYKWELSTGLDTGVPRGVQSTPLGASGRALLKKINRDGTAHSDCGHYCIGRGQGGRKGGKEQDRSIWTYMLAHVPSLSLFLSLWVAKIWAGLVHQTHPEIMEWNLPPFIASLRYFIMVTIKAVYHPYRFIFWNFNKWNYI